MKRLLVVMARDLCLAPLSPWAGCHAAQCKAAGI
jgi:hypothetical protein